MNASRIVTFATAGTVLALVIACGGSSSGGGGAASIPTCQGSTGATGAGSSACSTCLQTSCSAQVSAAETSCSTYLTCYQGCKCSDLTCLEGCLPDTQTGTCPNAYGPLTTCLTQTCGAQCTTTIAIDASTD